MCRRTAGYLVSKLRQKNQALGLLAMLATIARWEGYKQIYVPSSGLASKGRVRGAVRQVLISVSPPKPADAIGSRRREWTLWGKTGRDGVEKSEVLVLRRVFVKAWPGARTAWQ